MSKPEQWWFNHKTGEVEQGRLSLGMHRDGPFASKEEAERAPDIARERSANWDADDTP